MENSSPDYKQLFLQAQRAQQEAERAKQEAERGQQEAERGQQEAERAQHEAERAQHEAERATRKTTLPEFLDACHGHLHSSLVVQTDASLSTKGDPSNANNKVRPEEIRVWEDFPKQQEKAWQALMNSDFITQRHFTSINALRELGESIFRRKMGSELDLHYFERATVEDQVSLILEHLYANPYLRQKYNLRGLVQFENHGNTLTPEVELEEDMQQMRISERGRRRSPRFLEREQAHETTKAAASSTSLPLAESLKFARPRADQFCVYNVPDDLSNTGSRTAIFITEYKPPHKLTLSHIYEGLEDMRVENVIVSKDTDGSKERCRRLLAAVITQAFSYMVLAGLEFGCIRSGEASIFLRVPEDPRTAYYFLSVPKNDVGVSTGWDQEGDSDNRLHLTTAGQMLAFTLQALQKAPRSHSWKKKALSILPKWNVMYEEVLESIAAEDVEASEYQPSPHAALLRASPIRLRRQPHRQSTSSCASNDFTRENQSEGDNSDPESPSRHRLASSTRSARAGRGNGSEGSQKSRSTSSFRQYCTHLCLLGLMNGGVLDPACPNAQQHGHCRHQIDQRELVALLREQLNKSMDENFDAVGRPGSRGVPFAVTLTSHGYTIAAKCSPPWFADRLKYEASVYHRLQLIQGIHVPACFGYMDLPEPYFYEGRAILSCALLFSFGGTPISRHVNSRNIAQLCRQFDACLRSIHALGVRHQDARSPNVLRDANTGRVMIIDFERAKMEHSRPALGEISPNRKRKREEDITHKHCGRTRMVEGGQLKTELQALVRNQFKRIS